MNPYAQALRHTYRVLDFVGLRLKVYKFLIYDIGRFANSRYYRNNGKFLEKARPPEEMRVQLDVNYKIEGQSVLIYETRPRWDNKEEYRDYAIAKATYIRSKNHWKVFWMRADLKWHAYPPAPTVKSLQEFTQVVKEDKHHCFWG